jgi:serine/threonine protein phosphatase PrpC
MADRSSVCFKIMCFLLQNYSENPISYYAVYDGHGGTNVAEYVESHLHFNILQHALFNSEPEKAIAESFMNTQESLKKHADRLLQSNTAGSTAVVIIIKGKQMFIAWAGDSLASLFMSDGTIHELIDPHKPGKPSEKERIEKLGGYVREEAGGVLRVNSAVAVSRAFGNIRHKVIIPEADVRVRELTGQEAFLVLACDGLWDVMTPQEVRQFVGIYFTRNGRRLKGISEALVDEALRRGSTDNVSVVFVQFNGWNMPKT